MMRLALGYPDPRAERELLRGGHGRERLPQLGSLWQPEDVAELRNGITRVTVSDALIDYVMAIVNVTRSSGAFTQGLSPRAAQSLVRAARAFALLDGRDFVTPEDVQAIGAAVIGHRLTSRDGARGMLSLAEAHSLISGVAIP